MGEPQRSLVTTGVLSTQQLMAATNYLKQLFSGLVALTQINSGDLSRAIERVLSSEQGTSVKVIDIKRQDKLINYFFSISTDTSIPPSPPAAGSVSKTLLTLEEVAIFVQVCSYLCQQHQELIRRAVSLMEQLAGEGTDPWLATLLDSYSQSLGVYYSHVNSHKLRQLGAKLLLDLLFYSSAYGQERLWRRCVET
jgi:predicted RNA-binding protein with RPS1 domain